MIASLAGFQLLNFGLGIEMRSDCANYFDGADAVSNCHHFVSIKTLLAGPDPPLPFHGAGGIDKNSVEIEEDGGAGEGHSLFYHKEC